MEPLLNVLGDGEGEIAQQPLASKRLGGTPRHVLGLGLGRSQCGDEVVRDCGHHSPVNFNGLFGETTIQHVLPIGKRLALRN